MYKVSVVNIKRKRLLLAAEFWHRDTREPNLASLCRCEQCWRFEKALEKDSSHFVAENVLPCEIPSCQISLTVWMPGYQPFLGKPKPLIWWGHRLRARSDINLARFCLDCVPFQLLRYAEHDNECHDWQTLLCGTTLHPGCIMTSILQDSTVRILSFSVQFNNQTDINDICGRWSIGHLENWKKKVPPSHLLLQETFCLRTVWCS